MRAETRCGSDPRDFRPDPGKPARGRTRLFQGESTLAVDTDHTFNALLLRHDLMIGSGRLELTVGGIRGTPTAAMRQPASPLDYRDTHGMHPAGRAGP